MLFEHNVYFWILRRRHWQNDVQHESCDSDFDGAWPDTSLSRTIYTHHWKLKDLKPGDLINLFQLFVSRLYVGCSRTVIYPLTFTTCICLCVSGWADCSEQEEEIWKSQGKWLQQWLWVWWERWSEQWGRLGDVGHHETAQEQGRTWSRTSCRDL